MFKKTILSLFVFLYPALMFSQFNTVTRNNHQSRMQVLKDREQDTENEIGENVMGEDIDIEQHNALTPDDNIILPANLYDTLKFSLPLKDIVINSKYGVRKDPFSGKRKIHSGLDLKADKSPVFSMLPGRVKKVGYDKRAGIFVTIENPVFSYSYCHLSKINVLQDDYVSAGQMVAVSGNTGNSTGPHLHITCRWKDNNKVFNPLILINLIRKERRK